MVVSQCWHSLDIPLGNYTYMKEKSKSRCGVGPVARFIGAELVPLKYRSLMTAVTFSENTVT